MSAPLTGCGFFCGDFFQQIFVSAIRQQPLTWTERGQIVLNAQLQWTATRANICLSSACLLPSSTQPAVCLTPRIQFENCEELSTHENQKTEKPWELKDQNQTGMLFALGLVWAVSCHDQRRPRSGGHPASLATQPSGVIAPCLAVLLINSPQEPVGGEVRNKDWVFYFKKTFCMQFFIFFLKKSLTPPLPITTIFCCI